ncbi:unnamed protein product [Nippostrongylus brasiliensis]|uniref:Uncharacterized protein n=1 Tax=Nippostrongylus brasiliensis TaxID=27835 RepID=A0A0N4YK17_NIPBR|nr:unnamed protein product [Nippostrongylus brasiliensis]
MSWRNQSPREFDPHGGRNAFRNDDTLQSNSERVASFRAMRSFTESIECDLPPAPELPAQLDIDRISMRTSDTNETIIEVVKGTNAVDPSLGETQKYKMSVPGPGHSEQEHELHKSLLRDDDDLDSEVEGALAPGERFLHLDLLIPIIKSLIIKNLNIEIHLFNQISSR